MIVYRFMYYGMHYNTIFTIVFIFFENLEIHQLDMVVATVPKLICDFLKERKKILDTTSSRLVAQLC